MEEKHPKQLRVSGVISSNLISGNLLAGTPGALTVRSILAADVGSAFTKVVLIGVVEGEYRLLARSQVPSTFAAPAHDVTAGLFAAFGELERITGRQLVSVGQLLTPEEDDETGVDAFVAMSSVGGPLRVVVTGIVEGPAVQAAVAAVSGAYTEVLDVVTASRATDNTTGAQGVRWVNTQVEKIQELAPQVVLIAGGVDNGAVNSLLTIGQIVSAALSGQSANGRRTPVIYAGNAQAFDRLKGILQDNADVRKVDNLQPQLDRLNLSPTRKEITTIYQEVIIQTIPGYDRLNTWGKVPIVPTASGFHTLIRFLARYRKMNVVGVDVGASSTLVLAAAPRDDINPLINTSYGLGQNAGNILSRAGHENVARWLSFAISKEELWEYVINKMIRPQTIPQTMRDVLIELALAREALRLTLEQQPILSKLSSIDYIVGSGGALANCPSYGDAGLVLLDTIEPVSSPESGISWLLLDAATLAPQIGAIGAVDTAAAAQVTKRDFMPLRLGPCVIPTGEGEDGALALRVILESNTGRTVTEDVPYGSIKVIPLGVSERAALTLQPAASFNVGLGLGEHAAPAEDIVGGLLGLIIDARGRPLRLPTNPATRQAKLIEWAEAMKV